LKVRLHFTLFNRITASSITTILSFSLIILNTIELGKNKGRRAIIVTAAGIIALIICAGIASVQYRTGTLATTTTTANTTTINQVASSSSKAIQLLSQIAAEINVPLRAQGDILAINPNTNTIYVLGESGDISLINGSTNKVENVIQTEMILASLDINPVTNKIYAITEISPYQVVVIDGSTRNNTGILKHIPLEDIVDEIAVNPDTNKIYVSRGAYNAPKEISVIDGSNDTIADKIEVKDVGMFGLFLNSDKDTIYTANTVNSSLLAIDGKTNRIVADIAIGGDPRNSAPHRVAFDTKTNTIYVAPVLANRLFVIDGNTHSLMTSIAAGNSSVGNSDIVFDPNNDRIYMIDSLGTLSIIDRAGGLTAKAEIERDSFAMILNPQTSMIYIASQQRGGMITAINMKSTIEMQSRLDSAEEPPGIRVGAEPQALAINPVTNKVYVANLDSSTISVINGSDDRVISQVKTAKEGPWQVVVNSDTNMVYVHTSEDYGLTIIDGAVDRIIDNVTDVGSTLTRADAPVLTVGVSQEANRVYVAQFPNIFIQIDGESNVVVNSTTMEDLLIPVEGISSTVLQTGWEDDRLFAFHNSDFENSLLYVIDITSNTTGIFGTVTNTIHLDHAPFAISINPNNDLVYATNSYNNSVSVIDPYVGKSVEDIKVGDYPYGIAIDSSANLIYVSNRNDDTVSVINGTDNKLITNIPVGKVPTGIAVNSQTGLVYVANSASDSVSVIDSSDISANRTLVGAKFIVNPPNAGHIVCRGNEVPTNEYIRISFRSDCHAEPTAGYRFGSWIQNLGGGSSKTVSVSATSSALPLGFFQGLFGLNQRENAATYQIPDFGNYTVSFNEQFSSQIPPEYLFGLYTLAAGVFTSWLVPTVAHGVNATRQRKRVARYLIEIEDMRKKNEMEKEKLDKIRHEVIELYSKGKLGDSHYDVLSKEISKYEEESRRSEGRSTK
jgi:YVTN family beta-propeller protein